MKKNAIFTILFVIASIALCVVCERKLLPISREEVLAFVTGALCVWLTVLENIWNWPIGILNSAIFLDLFYRDRLFADSFLQVLYIILGFLGWYWWLKGGTNRSELTVSRTPIWGWIILPLAGVLGGWLMYRHLVEVKDSAPLLDSVTTMLSLVAQFQLTKKYIENWWIWITADVIYIYLYSTRGLYLTAVLYALFIVMCGIGLRDWRRSLSRTQVSLEPVHA